MTTDNQPSAETTRKADAIAYYQSGASELRKGIFATLLTTVAGLVVFGAIQLSERRIQAEELCAARDVAVCEQDNRCHVESDGLASACPDDAPHCHDLCVRGMASR